MRLHGRHGMFYMAVAASGTPQPVAFISGWEMNFTATFDDVTTFGNRAHVWVTDVVQCSGSLTGFYDDTSRQFYTAARDGIPRNFYLYPDTVNDPGEYWFGQMLPDFTVSGGSGQVVGIQCAWQAESAVFFGVHTGSTYQAAYAAVYPGRPGGPDGNF